MRIFLFHLLLFFSYTTLTGQGIEFFEGSWQEAIEEAKKSEQIVFVDAYTTWCGPCKKMSREVFPDPEVGKFFNGQFVNLKLDMESESGRAFNSKYPVRGYPTYLFINGEGEVIHRASGFRPAEAFINIAKIALRKDDRSEAMHKSYEEGERSFAFMLKYVKALVNAGKPHLKIANEYLDSNPSISKKEKTEFLYYATTESDSRLFDALVKNRKVLASMKTEQEIDKKILSSCEKTIEKAIEFESEFLLHETQEKVQKILPKKANGFTITSNMAYYESLGYIDRYLAEVKKYGSQIIDKDDRELLAISDHLFTNYRKNQQAMKLAEDLAKKSTKLKDSSDGFMNYSRILLANGKKDQAVRFATKALATARLNGEKTQVIERYIEYLETE